MRELNLVCDWNGNDKMIATSTNPECAVIGVYGDDQLAEILFHREKAKQLRDWLNEFLGESK